MSNLDVRFGSEGDIGLRDSGFSCLLRNVIGMMTMMMPLGFFARGGSGSAQKGHWAWDKQIRIKVIQVGADMMPPISSCYFSHSSAPYKKSEDAAMHIYKKIHVLSPPPKRRNGSDIKIKKTSELRFEDHKITASSAQCKCMQGLAYPLWNTELYFDSPCPKWGANFGGERKAAKWTEIQILGGPEAGCNNDDDGNGETTAASPSFLHAYKLLLGDLLHEEEEYYRGSNIIAREDDPKVGKRKTPRWCCSRLKQVLAFSSLARKLGFACHA